jgi:hypothetical protein
MNSSEPYPYTAYFDDSGTDPSSSTAVAACYVGKTEQWKMLEGDWNDARKQFGFSTFGTADVLGGKEEYRSWSREKRLRLIRSLSIKVGVRAAKGFAYCVSKEDYDAEIQSELRGVIGKEHYTFVVRGCLAEIKHWRIHNRITAPMLYVFDQMRKGKGELLEMFDRLVSNGEGQHFGLEHGGYVWESKVHYAGLQAVDVLAHSTFLRMCVRAKSDARVSPGDFLDRLYKYPLLAKFWDVENLRDYAQRCSLALDKTGWGEPLSMTLPKKRSHVAGQRD